MKNIYWQTIWQRFKQNRRAFVGLLIVALLFFTALFAPFIANNKPYILVNEKGVYFPIVFDHSDLVSFDYKKDIKSTDFYVFPPIKYSVSEYDLDSIVLPPSKKHLLGTDEQGRDIASRMIHGTRVSILIGFVAVGIYVLIGIIIGGIAGYYGGLVDLFISRFIEIVICFPTFFLILAILALMKPDLIKVMVVIGLTSWTGIARIVRGEFLKYRESEFVTAARAMGQSDMKIIFSHILPNSLAPVLVSATFGIASTILIESSLSFLGFGVQPPQPSWGQILSQSRDFIDFAWWLTLIPGFAIFITITSYNLIGEGLQEAFDPKSTK